MSDEFWVESREKSRSFFDDYVIGGVMGKGVTSCVYRCKNKNDDSDWACKVIQKEGQGKRKKVVSSEIEALLKLSHPNIVQMRQIYESAMEVFIVLELADGGELFDRIVKKGHYSEKEAARVVNQVMSALDYAHSKGIVHRDIKPENILYQSVSDDSLIKISDFGFAKEFDEKTIMSTFCGTIGYCAPEVILKEAYTSAVDIWSLGVVLYILLCGYEPFWDETGEPGVTRKIVKGEYEFESPYWDDISQAARDFVVQMMSVDPLKRPSAKSALENAWVKGHTAQDTHLQRTQERIREFNAKRKFKAAGRAVLAINSLSSGNVEK
jgi:calcium/calmodulin-dependent protein kinase-4